MTQSLAPEGRLLVGRYRLDRLLGRGGMGWVWAAHDEMLGRDVAVKEVVPPPDLPPEQRETLRRRTLREARAAARIAHPSAVTVYDVVEEGGRPYIVMQLLPARTLADLLVDSGPLSPARAARIGVDLVDALDTAHEAGVLHRDVKPANVMLTESGRAVLTDFGIATVDDDPTLTTTGMLVGSPAYMAPERARGERPTPAGDLWSLGATLFAMVEGEPPFRREGQLPTLNAVLTEEPPPAGHAGPLRPVIAALLSRDPAARPSAPVARDMLLRAATAAAEAETQVHPSPAGQVADVDEPDGDDASGADEPDADDPSGAAEPAATDRLEVAPASGATAPAGAQPALVPAPPAQTQPAETPPAQTQPAQTQPAQTPPAQTRPSPAPAPVPVVPAAPRVPPGDDREPTPQDRRGPGRGVVAALVVLLLALAGVGLARLLEGSGGAPSPSSTSTGGGTTGTAGGGSGPSAGNGGSGRSSGSTTGQSGSGPASGTSGATGSGRGSSQGAGNGAGAGAGHGGQGGATIPAGFRRHSDPTGFSLLVPASWTVTRNGTDVTFHQPGGRAYLLVPQTTQPAADSLRDWQDQERAASPHFAGYQRIRLERVPFHPGWDVADWEFRWTPSGGTLHVLDRNLRISDRRAYALYWSVPDQDWARMHSTFTTIAGSFRPAP